MRPLLAHCYSTLAQLAHEQGDHEKATEFLVMAQSLARELGMKLWSEAVGASEAVRQNTATQGRNISRGSMKRRSSTCSPLPP